MTKKLFATMLAAILMLVGCGTSTTEDKTNGAETEKKESKEKKEEAVALPQLSTEVADNERLVEMETTMGNIKIKLFPEYAPQAVENFIGHSENGYYEGVIFHRVINDFMIQGGDPQGTGMGGESIFGQPFEDEFSDKLYNFRGALSMANSGPNTNGSQFFIVQKTDIEESLVDQMEQAGFRKEAIEAYENNGGTPWLDNKHTVFGQVIEGMEIVDKIANTEVGEGDKPVEDVIIKKINVIK
ncbi:peptidylprolyl isomerase [Bacillus sp. 31A1R]|uniref:Peptidyl-prolyl cis-trans isomerase n=1 Tax=Robertmurraya mangrovi TaxID=3098077 RepID=A0ABU5IY21_9BACI|nr:peptidylprolyl isomerase [Bacillus sp. 31A1R]MDZ5472069.1 peptidylprolyl isomerase [Bacillus sp. 31A1R]